MRFHIGCSFRPKNLLKFIFPFLLGLLAMFGIDHVNAQTRTIYERFNYNWYMELGDYSELLNTTIPGLEYSPTTLNEYLKSFWALDNDYVFYSYFTDTNYHFVFTTSQYCSNTTELKFDYFGRSGYQLRFVNNTSSNPNCTFSDVSFSFLSDRVSFNQENFTKATQNLSNVNNLYGVVVSYNMNIVQDISNFQTNADTTFNATWWLYDTNTTLVLDYLSSNQPTSVNPLYKTLNINGVALTDPSQLPTYKDIYGTYEGQLNVYSPTLPYNYFSMNKSEISSFEAELTYFPNINASDYVANINGGELNFYGRYNHNDDYYTYELITCTLSRTSNINSDQNRVKVSYNNLSCSSDLTNYDKIYIYESFDYESGRYGSTDLSVYNVNLTSNVDSYSSSQKKGLLYEPLTLQNGFKLLISSSSQNGVDFLTTNDYVSYNKLSNEDLTSIDNTLGGVEIGYNHVKSGGRNSDFYSLNYGSYDQSMYYIYDNYTLHENTTTYLQLFIDNPLTTLISFPVDINGQDTFSYYNNEGNITTGTTIQTNYGDIGGNYSQNYYSDTTLFDPINNFLDSIEEDLISMHELNQMFFDNIPSFIKSFIIVIYSLFLLSILFKEVKR